MLGDHPPDAPVRTSYVCDRCKESTSYEGDPPDRCGTCGAPVRKPVSADPDRPCPHEDFQSFVAIARVAQDEGGPIIGFSAEVRVTCIQCGEPFRFTGCPAGVRPDRPTVSADERTLYAPIRPASADPDFGMGIPGFAVTYHERDET